MKNENWSLLFQAITIWAKAQFLYVLNYPWLKPGAIESQIELGFSPIGYHFSRNEEKKNVVYNQF
ncbi:MAG: hypothetical protein WCX31_06455 [Salinivirgaceae bacterium]|jgi:hypothetical protein